MTRIPRSIDIRGQMIVLGSGTSVGVPSIGCDCDVCLSDDPHNRRTRCSVVLGLPGGNLLIDTPPDLREQLLREGIGIVHSVLYTHEHTDHMFGIDDLRLMQFYLDGPVPLYCEAAVDSRIRRICDYAFREEPETHVGSTPKLDLRPIGTKPFEVLGATVTPIRLKHGPRFDVLGFRVGNVAYCTDTNEIPDASYPLLEGLDVLILDALRHRPHPTHFSIAEAVAAAQRIGAKKTYFTHICHDLDHAKTCKELPEGIELAYDGLCLDLT
jgi:phosphoribosyl 1,2-cyclic phosphate phosphodiesterase